jgi:hypothetical protein
MSFENKEQRNQFGLERSTGLYFCLLVCSKNEGQIEMEYIGKLKQKL